MKRKVGKRNFSYWFAKFFILIKRSGSPLLFVSPIHYSRHPRKAKTSCFLPFPKAPKSRTIKNTLRFELHLHLCFGKTDAADRLRLEQQGGFGRICWFALASRAGLAGRGESELLSFVLSFQKRKYIKRRLLHGSQIRERGRNTPSVTTSSCQLTLFSATPARVLANLPRRERQIYTSSPQTRRTVHKKFGNYIL